MSSINNQAILSGRIPFALTSNTHLTILNTPNPEVDLLGLQKIADDFNYPIMNNRGLCFPILTHCHGEPARDNFPYRGITAPMGGVNPDLLDQFSYLITKFILYDTNNYT